MRRSTNTTLNKNRGTAAHTPTNTRFVGLGEENNAVSQLFVAKNRRSERVVLARCPIVPLRTPTRGIFMLP